MLPGLQPTDALIVVDVQNDFCPGGALPVPEGDQVVCVLNEWIDRAEGAGAVVVVSRDWHPPDHCSFRPCGGPWPVHCVRETPGARYHPGLRIPPHAIQIDKATTPQRESYSDFAGTGLARTLRGRGVRRVWVGGLALDYCVRATVLDALAEGFKAHLILAGTRAVNVRPGDGRRAVAELRRAGATVETASGPAWVDDSSAPLLVDLYELTMLQAYLEKGMEEQATFDLFVRRLPAERNHLVACGLDDVLRYLETFRFGPAALEYLESMGRFSPQFLDRLEALRFCGDVRAMPEGTAVFAGEPILQVTASLPEAQIIETFVLNQMSFQTLVASKAARVVAAARGREVIEFGLRRLHGTDAGMKAARACFVAGVGSTSNVLAAKIYSMPAVGTMAHSYVEAHDEEIDAFRAFSSVFPDATLLVDTYDTLDGVRNVVRLAAELGGSFRIRGIRLDSGDLGALAASARRILDDAGLHGVRIFASGGLDEHIVADLTARGAPIDGFGVGTRMGVSADAPYLDSAYKIAAYAGRDRMKLASGKVTLPGRKQVFRVERDGVAVHDVIALQDERIEGRPLLEKVMEGGRRTAAGLFTLREAIERCRDETARLPAPIRSLEPADPPYPVRLGPRLQAEFDQLSRVLRVGAAS
jgi:nicotinate phosphoribosyltransferase